jgi:pSer/pThr/pTyr-binding forkhead associated (FHA) protein
MAAAAPAPAAEAAPAAPAAPTAAPAAAALPPGAQPKLVVIRGQKINAEYPIYPDLNFIGRADEKPVDIDLEDQEPPDRIWCSRQHALITLEESILTIEDLNSANGTYVNRARVYPGQKKQLSVGDTIQIGNVQMKVKI